MSTFNGTPFNDEQLDYMRSLAAIPDDELGWCGWGRVGPDCCCNPECPGKAGKTLADAKLVWCPECHNKPWADGTITHNVMCKRRPANPKTGGSNT